MKKFGVIENGKLQIFGSLTDYLRTNVSDKLKHKLCYELSRKKKKHVKLFVTNEKISLVDNDSEIKENVIEFYKINFSDAYIEKLITKLAKKRIAKLKS